jgi:threonylcarbamoyladenosine tRNA methylthiotransferase MtaB
LQSGSTAVLKSMNRHYTSEEYIEKCKRIYEAFENAAITTDIIVGFPTETEEDFLLSLAMVKEVGFSQIHAFPYSPREGTNAYKKYKELSADIKKERVARILEEGALAKNAYLQKQIGRTLCVVPERYENGYTEGYGENYVRVYVQGDAFDEPVFATVQGLYKDGVWAKACEK